MTSSPFSFGTPLSSIKNTSFANLSDPISSVGFSGAPLGSSMIDPGTATVVGAGISSVANIIGGQQAGKGAKSAADQYRDAMEEQAKQVTQANRETLLGSFGLEDIAQKQDMIFGGPRERFDAFGNQQFARAMSQGPGAQADARQTMARNLAMRQAEHNKFVPMTRFV